MTWAILLGSFVLGSVPVGYLIAKRRGIDIQRVGSGNIGATNVARTLGRRAGSVVLFLDAGKGALAVVLSSLLTTDSRVIAAAGFLAIVGHCVTPWLRFRGGKGVATSLGVFATLAPIETLGAAIVWLVMYGVWRTASIASITAAVVLPVTLMARHAPTPVWACAAGAAAVVVTKHAPNIRRLLRGEERRTKE